MKDWIIYYIFYYLEPQLKTKNTPPNSTVFVLFFYGRPHFYESLFGEREMSDEEHHFESKADAGASKTFPQQAGTIRKNGYINIKNRPCKVFPSLSIYIVIIYMHSLIPLFSWLIVSLMYSPQFYCLFLRCTQILLGWCKYMYT